MNPNIQHLFNIARKPSRRIIGLMSGTSLDGLDIALCSIHGNGITTKLEVLHFETIGYTGSFKKEIRAVFAKENIELKKLCLLNPQIALQHAAMVNDCLKKWEVDATGVDLIASHGQTIYHSPGKEGSASLQIGDGDHLAVVTGIITISDFRQKHIAGGGAGAPLSVYGDIILFSKEGEDRVLLNIGGIANFTYLPGRREDGKIICTDVGPGNTLMDAFVLKEFPGKYFDEDGAIAKSGTIRDRLLIALKENNFFDKPFPKTTGPELFNLAYLEAAKQKSNIISLSVEDSMATLNTFSADMIAAGISACIKNKKGVKLFVSGGGIQNLLLMQHLKEQLPGCSFHSTAELGIDPAAKEAVLFALLANECVCGDPSFFGNLPEGIPAVSMGKVSFPV
jgi:anhydro-N-acetylmuramic acid kinase